MYVFYLQAVEKGTNSQKPEWLIRAPEVEIENLWNRQNFHSDKNSSK